ncbi:tubulin monoglycylase TTLL3-like isoform X1 [Channa argus]|uniref:tubulin monoglycylase TTLL3-like isoform X1 n=1 Tax=Channa argus TaxID=215402 RepID=UPI0029453ABB|nr:hypothetical protein Q8A73_005549 [Channa argus]
MPQAPVLQTTAALAERRIRCSVPSIPTVKLDRLKTAKALVEKAVKLRKVFSVRGPYPVIRAALWARGWVERRLPPPVQRAPHCHGDEEEEEEEEDDCDVNADVSETADEHKKQEILGDMYNLMSRLVRNETTYFYWTTRRDDIDCRSLRNDQMTNHYANAGTFTTKVGLCINMRNLQWFDSADPDTFFPRCYRLGAEDEKHAFIEDFRRTACTSLLQYVVETNRDQGDGPEVKDKDKNCVFKELVNVKPKFVGAEMVETALHICQKFLSVLEHGDIDVTVETPHSLKEQQWAVFLQNYYMVVHEDALIRGSSVFVERCQDVLRRLKEVCPQLDTDGLDNIWIIKPGAKSRGRGILCMNHLDEILGLTDTDRALNNESKWVVQKYLERPLLVHGTKFDLRQWFLVTDWNPLTVWFYRECYLRFSTQPYSTKTLDSSVHLCNNSIQKHFQPSHERHPGVPDDSMWSCSQFRAFLQQQGCEADWESVVIPGMQRAIVHALQTAQDLVEPRKASFELYGADFMLGRDMRPWLLEINASPTMACSTAVTARLCPAVQLDTLRVVLDRRTDPSAFTGSFQLIYKQAAVEVPQYVGVNLLVQGLPIKGSRTLLRRKTAVSNSHITNQLPPTSGKEEKHKLSSQKIQAVGTALRRPGKENRVTREKKRQLSSVSSKREGEGRTEVQNTYCVQRACLNLPSEQFQVAHAEPKKKARCLGLSLGANKTTLVPRTVSFSFDHPCSVSDYKPQSIPHRRSHIPRCFLLQAALEHQHKQSTYVFPTVHGTLSILEGFSLGPISVAGTPACHATFPSHPSFHRHQLVLPSHKQSVATSTVKKMTQGTQTLEMLSVKTKYKTGDQ